MKRREFDQLSQSDRFYWATGIEDTFIHSANPKTGRLMDEYELTDHYRRWSEDLDLLASLGVQKVRYGIPWHRVNPAPGKWDWSWAEKPIHKLLDLGIDPIVDLVHYGVPAWLENAYLHPDFPSRMAEYAAAVAEKFKGQILWYTPLNEPRIAAWYCGKLGWWPPYRRGWANFLKILLQICRGIIQSEKALHSIDPEIVLVHVDATDLYSTSSLELIPEVQRRQEIVFLALDLIGGRVDSAHPLWQWLRANAVQEHELDWFFSNKIDLDIIGINMYPMFTVKEILQKSGKARIRMHYGAKTMVERLAELYWERYQRPLMITETASLGSARRRIRWLEESVDSIRLCRGRGILVIGYTWWPMYGLVAWSYRQGRRPMERYILQMGLWDLKPTLDRIETPVATAFRKLINTGLESFGPYKNSREELTSAKISGNS
jgi:beta-glucosidase